MREGGRGRGEVDRRGRLAGATRGLIGVEPGRNKGREGREEEAREMECCWAAVCWQLAVIEGRDKDRK